MTIMFAALHNNNNNNRIVLLTSLVRLLLFNYRDHRRHHLPTGLLQEVELHHQPLLPEVERQGICIKVLYNIMISSNETSASGAHMIKI